MTQIVGFLAALAQAVYALFTFGSLHSPAPLPPIATSTPQATQQVAMNGWKHVAVPELGIAFDMPANWYLSPATGGDVVVASSTNDLDGTAGSYVEFRVMPAVALDTNCHYFGICVTKPFDELYALPAGAVIETDYTSEVDKVKNIEISGYKGVVTHAYIHPGVGTDAGDNWLTWMRVGAGHLFANISLRESHAVEYDRILNSLTITGSTSLASSTPSSESADAGMISYTDADFGFSFWYPSTWQVGQKYGGGGVFGDARLVARFDVGGTTGQPLYIMEFTSASGSIELAGDQGTLKYFFDAAKRQWMVTITGAANGSPDKTMPAPASQLTMSGLRMLDGNARFGAATLVPLNAHNFVLVTTPADPGVLSQTPLARTIIVSNGTHAPTYSSAQAAVIQAEKDAYAAQ